MHYKGYYENYENYVYTTYTNKKDRYRVDNVVLIGEWHLSLGCRHLSVMMGLFCRRGYHL